MWSCNWRNVDSGVAEKLDSPVWMDRDGKECQHIEACGCKLIHHIKHPDMCIVGDEVGGNTSQKGDGHVGGTSHWYERNNIPQSKTSNKDNRFILIGLTTLTDKPLMCCVIFKGVKCCVDTETGIDFTVKVNIISNTQQDLFKNNFEDEIASFEQLSVMINYSMEIHSIERIRRDVFYYFNIFFWNYWSF